MTPTPRAAAAVIAATLVLVGSAACQNEPPDPAPTAVLPTPEVPTATGPADPSSSQAEEVARNAASAYVDGRELAEQMLIDGDYMDATERLRPYFSGAYLSYWETEFAEFEREGWSTSGTVKFTVVDFTDYEINSTGEAAISLFTCVDFREAKVTDEQGREIDRGYEFSLDRVEMTGISDKWKADGLDSGVLVDPIGDTPCADVF